MPGIGPTVAKRVGRTFPRRTLPVRGAIVGHDFNDADQQVYTYSDKSLGPEAADRRVFFLASGRSNSNNMFASKVVLQRAGEDDVVLEKSVTDRSADLKLNVSMFEALVPTGETGTFVVTYRSTVLRSGCAWGWVTGAEDYGIRVVPELSSAINPAYTDLSVWRNSFGVSYSAACDSAESSLAAAWTNYDEDFAAEKLGADPVWHAAATKIFEQTTKIPVAVDWSPTPNLGAAAIFVVWRPKAIDRPGKGDPLAALRAGGVNVVNTMYVETGYSPDNFNSEFEIIYRSGGRHVRLPLGMNTLEDGTTGNLRQDRWNDLKRVVNAARAERLVTLICVVNTFQTDFESDPNGNTYMGFLTTRAARHLSLVTQLAEKINDELDLNWVVYQPFNEPLFDHGGGEEAVWYDHQDAMVPAIRAVAPNLWLFVGAHRNQAFWATRGTSVSDNFLFKGSGTYPTWWDDKCIVDFHYYRPNPLTHCSDNDQSPVYCPINTWPGTYNGVRSYDNVTVNGTWDAAQLADDIGDLAAWAASLTPPLTRMHISEIGAKLQLPEAVTAAYLRDLCDALEANGIGWTVWDWYQTFRIKNKPAAVKAAFRG